VRKTGSRPKGKESTVPPQARQSDTTLLKQEPSSQRSRVPDVVPAAWLDRLLAAAIDLPVTSGERAVLTSVVEAVAAILPDYAVGACFVPATSSAPRQRDQQVLVKRLPEGVRESSAGVDPTRLFPSLAHEHVAPLPGSTTGSTLHVASDVDPLGHAQSSAVHLVDRAALVLSRALRVARDLASPARAGKDAQVLEQRLMQADKLATFGQIAAGVVHELNNPLTSIVAYSDYLIRKALADATAAAPRDEDDLERLRRISESANRMLRFTRDLVSYARPSNGVAGPVVLHGVIDQAVAFCEHVLATAGVRVDKRYGTDVLTVRGVSEQLVQVFVNLLTNASQAAPAAQGLVVLTTSVQPESRRIRVVVEDNGSGIAREHLAQVFVPFFTTKGDRHGTGLGLSIVKSILEAHDGEIHVESAPGRGARFVLELPTWSR
jgi:two-component system, NtrC family, sensor kinase